MSKDRLEKLRMVAQKEVTFENYKIGDVYINSIQVEEQVRKTFVEDDIKELALSMKESGLLEPVIIKPVDHERYKYKLVIGERRIRAAKYLKWEKIKAVIQQIDEGKETAWQIIENLQRKDLNNKEIAMGFKSLKESGVSNTEMVKMTGKNKVYISKILKIAELFEKVADPGIVHLPYETLYNLSLKMAQENFAELLTIAKRTTVSEFLDAAGAAAPKSKKKKKSEKPEDSEICFQHVDQEKDAKLKFQISKELKESEEEMLKNLRDRGTDIIKSLLAVLPAKTNLTINIKVDKKPHMRGEA